MRNYVSPSLPTVVSSVPTPPSIPRAKLPETPTDVTFPPSVPLAEQRLPSARVVQTQPATSAMPPVVQRLLSGFVLQAGVFSSQQRAEELHAKLTLSGVPSTLETRVQVGPFKTRQEAEAAQEKLRELGIGSVLVPPNKSGKH
jgi:DedD protein